MASDLPNSLMRGSPRLSLVIHWASKTKRTLP